MDSQKFYGVKSTVLSTVDLAELSGALEGGFNLIFLFLFLRLEGGKRLFICSSDFPPCWKSLLKDIAKSRTGK